MILDFAKACVIAMLLSAASAATALPLKPYGPDSPVDEVHRGPDGWAISIRCKHNGADDDCVIAATQNGQVKKTVVKSPVLPSVKWYSDIAMISFPCGTACRSDMFFSPTDKVDRHELVADEAIDIRRRLVVSLESNPLRVYRLFSGNKPVATLHLPISYTPPPAVEKFRWGRGLLDV